MGSDQEMEQRQKLGVESMFLCFQIIGWLFVTCTVFLHFEKDFKRSV